MTEWFSDRRPELYTCVGDFNETGGRCRNPRATCPDHPKGMPKSRRPDAVLVKRTLNKEMLRRFEAQGWRIAERTVEESGGLAIRHTLTAMIAGREDLNIRKELSGAPEDLDSGAQVMGDEGLQNVLVAQSCQELFTLGYLVKDWYILSRKHKPPFRMVVVFALAHDIAEAAKLKASNASFREEQLAFFLEAMDVPFGQVDVWANLPRTDGSVVYTVNCKEPGRTPGQPCMLRAAGGYYNAQGDFSQPPRRRINGDKTITEPARETATA